MRLFEILPVLAIAPPRAFKHRRRIRTCLFNSTLEQESFKMARKPGTRAGAEFVLFDVVYEDGSQRSNRRVPSAVLGGAEGDGPASDFIADQDRVIAMKSGLPAVAIKSVRRSGSKDQLLPARHPRKA